MTKIGKLIELPARDAWKHEAHNFTPWLSDNLDLLGDAIGLKLEPEGTEVPVGSFSADILAKDILCGRSVLIENQLESTDHNHLGQILTYLTGLEAEVVIWIATNFREEHLSAINWLNEHTKDKFSFFAIKLRVIKINDSIPAPIFDVLARPNEWERSLQKELQKTKGETSKRVIELRSFWEHYLKRHPKDAKLGVKITGAAHNWLTTPDSEEFVVSIYKAKDEVGVFLRGQKGVSAAETQNNLAPYVNIFKEKIGNCKNIGSGTNHPADTHVMDTQNKENWDQAVDWLHQRSQHFLKTITEIIKKKS